MDTNYDAELERFRKFLQFQVERAEQYLLAVQEGLIDPADLGDLGKLERLIEKSQAAKVAKQTQATLAALRGSSAEKLYMMFLYIQKRLTSHARFPLSSTSRIHNFAYLGELAGIAAVSEWLQDNRVGAEIRTLELPE